MAGRSKPSLARTFRLAAWLVGGVVVCWMYPLFHVKRLAPPALEPLTTAVEEFDPKARADAFWQERLRPEVTKATELTRVVQAVRAGPEAAITSFGKSAGVGAVYFFVRGSGKVVARERSVLRLAVDGASSEVVALRIGPVFGNAARDGTGLLDVNAFPGLREFNAFSAELNARVEQEVLPELREKAIVGATVHFAGCAPAPESAAGAGEALFTIVPVHAEVRP